MRRKPRRFAVLVAGAAALTTLAAAGAVIDRPASADAARSPNETAVGMPTSGHAAPAGSATDTARKSKPSKSGTRLAEWPTHCLDHVPNSPTDYQAAFDHRSDGWAGADGALPIPLPDGRFLWLFGDSLMGEIDENNALLPGWRMVRSVQVQDGACFTPITGGTVEEPTSIFPDEDGMIFWPAGGYVDDSVDPAVVRVVTTGVCSDANGWRGCDQRIHTLSLPDLELVSVDPVPYDTSLPGVPGLGHQLFYDAGMVYLYGHEAAFSDQTDPFVSGQYAARVPADQLVDGPWEYWTGDSWSPDINQARPMAHDVPENPDDLAQAGVIPWKDGYLMTGKQGELWVFGTEVYAWYSDSPAGPWEIVRQNGEPADLVPDASFPQDRWHYGGFLVTDVPGTSPEDPMVVFSTNGAGCDPAGGTPCTPDNDIALNVMLYGPHFFDPVGLP